MKNTPEHSRINLLDLFKVRDIQTLITLHRISVSRSLIDAIHETPHHVKNSRRRAVKVISKTMSMIHEFQKPIKNPFWFLPSMCSRFGYGELTSVSDIGKCLDQIMIQTIFSFDNDLLEKYFLNKVFKKPSQELINHYVYHLRLRWHNPVFSVWMCGFLLDNFSTFLSKDVQDFFALIKKCERDQFEQQLYQLNSMRDLLMVKQTVKQFLMNKRELTAVMGPKHYHQTYVNFKNLIKPPLWLSRVALSVIFNFLKDNSNDYHTKGPFFDFSEILEQFDDYQNLPYSEKVDKVVNLGYDSVALQNLYYRRSRSKLSLVFLKIEKEFPIELQERIITRITDHICEHLQHDYLDDSTDTIREYYQFLTEHIYLRPSIAKIVERVEKFLEVKFPPSVLLTHKRFYN